MIPDAVTTTSAVDGGSRTDLPFSVASTFHGAPRRIHRRRETNRTRWPGSSVCTNTARPADEPTCTATQQGPREATSTMRAAAVAVCSTVGAGAVWVAVVVGV